MFFKKYFNLRRENCRLRKKIKELKKLAFRDGLTDLYNKLSLKKDLELLIAWDKRDKKKSAIIFLDLDDFKNINDTYGHQIGDQLLIKIANDLKKSVKRETDRIYRFGGDEFILLLSKIDGKKGAEIVVKKILQNVSNYLNINGKKIKSSVSLGIYIFPKIGDNYNTVIDKADKALYKSKKKIERYTFY